MRGDLSIREIALLCALYVLLAVWMSFVCMPVNDLGWPIWVR